MLKYTVTLLILGVGGYLGVSGNPSGELETLAAITSAFLSRSVDFLKEGIDNAQTITFSQIIAPLISVGCMILWVLYVRLNKASDITKVFPVTTVQVRQEEEPKVVQEAKARALKGQLQADKHILQCKQRTLCEVMPKTKDELAKAQKSLIDSEKTVEYKRRLVRELCDKMEDQQADFLSNERDLHAIDAELEKLKSVA